MFAREGRTAEPSNFSCERQGVVQHATGWIVVVFFSICEDAA